MKQHFTSIIKVLFLTRLFESIDSFIVSPTTLQHHRTNKDNGNIHIGLLYGWVQDDSGEWVWEEDDPNYVPPEPYFENTIGGERSSTTTAATTTTIPANSISTTATATPSLPSGSFRPKQSLGQNFLRDGNTVAKIIKYFVSDASKTLINNDSLDQIRAVELGPTQVQLS